MSEAAVEHRSARAIAEIFALLERRGAAAYLGEPVSQLEHALQCAALAERRDGSPAFVVAALLHDVGHLVGPAPGPHPDGGSGARHETAGAVWLGRWLGPPVVEPVRLHVQAKRYLCAVEPEYLAGLSPASVASLARQGGPMGEEEVRAFEARPYCAEAVRLRRLDDLAKTPGLAVEPLARYRPHLRAALEWSSAR